MYSIYATKTSQKKSLLDPKLLSKRWGISTKVAIDTINATMQLGLRSGLYPLSRRFKTRQPQLQHNRLFVRYGCFYSDTMFSSIPSQRQNMSGQIFVNSAGFTYFVPMKWKSEAPKALHDFIVIIIKEFIG